MTTYAVISDIHGNANNLEVAIKTALANNAAFFLILGDLLNHGPRNGVPEGYDPMRIAEILNTYSKQTIIVRGNCDSEVDQLLLATPISGASNTLIINEHKCFMTHGHIYKEVDCPKLGLARGDYFLSGHTHVAVLKRNEQGVIVFNPGSITFPKGSANKSMGIITETEVKLTAITGELIQALEI